MNLTHVSLVEADPGYLQEHIAAITRAPDLRLVGAGMDLFGALSSGSRGAPIHVLVINASQPGMDELASWMVIHALLPGAAVVAMLQGPDDPGLVAAVAAGALGLYRLGTPRTRLVQCIRCVSRSVVDYDECLLARLKYALAQPDTALQEPSRKGTGLGGRNALGYPRASIGNLTQRESQVLEMLGRGHSNRAIASHLFVSEKTVRNCVSRLLAKLELASRTQAALWIRGYSQDPEPAGES